MNNMNIYEILNKIITEPHYYSMSQLFTNVDKSTIEEKDIRLFDLLNNISSMGTHVSNSGISFNPKFTSKDGSRSFAIEDINDEDYQILEKIDLSRLPLALRTIISDILWTQKKNHTASQIAARSYWEVFQLLYKDQKYYKALNPLKRAVCISQQTKFQALYSEIYEWFCNSFIVEAVQIDVFCALRIMKLFFEQKNTNYSVMLPVIDSIIPQNINKDNVMAVEQAYEFKTKCLVKLKKNEESIRCNLSLAQFYYDYAERMANNDSVGAFRSVSFFKKSVLLFRNNGDPANAEKVHRKLIDVQKQVPNNMHTFRNTFDISRVIENIKTNMDGLSFEESIIRLTQYLGFESIETLKKRTIDECISNPLSSLFGNNIIDSQGRTIIKISPLDDKDPEKDLHLLELHMIRSSLQSQRIIGDFWIRNILHYIRSKFIIDDSKIDFLVNKNCIIPEGREMIFRKGICDFLQGNYYAAMHILAPQMENLFRNIANEVGGLTSTLSDDGLAQEKVLSSVFSLPELLDAYDNDIIFAFRGLLNEQAGANIRNRIAHGIINEKECSSGECLYFGTLVIKLLSFTALACDDIINNIDKIKEFKIPAKDTIRIIK